MNQFKVNQGESVKFTLKKSAFQSIPVLGLCRFSFLIIRMSTKSFNENKNERRMTTTGDGEAQKRGKSFLLFCYKLR